MKSEYWGVLLLLVLGFVAGFFLSSTALLVISIICVIISIWNFTPLGLFHETASWIIAVAAVIFLLSTWVTYFFASGLAGNFASAFVHFTQDNILRH